MFYVAVGASNLSTLVLDKMDQNGVNCVLPDGIRGTNSKAVGK